jgi:hypothetical protein
MERRDQRSLLLRPAAALLCPHPSAEEILFAIVAAKA